MLIKRSTLILILVVLLASILFGLYSWAKSEEELDTVYVICQIDSRVIIRSSPRKKGIEEAWAEAGDEYLTDWKEKNGYLHVYGTFEAGEGWICKRYVTIWYPYVYRDGKAFTVNVKRVNCRQYIGGKRKGWLKKGTEVKVYVETPEWCVTNYGYIQTKYLDEVEDETDG